jgi:hypothetical protein
MLCISASPTSASAFGSSGSTAKAVSVNKKVSSIATSRKAPSSYVVTTAADALLKEPGLMMSRRGSAAKMPPPPPRSDAQPPGGGTSTISGIDSLSRLYETAKQLDHDPSSVPTTMGVIRRERAVSDVGEATTGGIRSLLWTMEEEEEYPKKSFTPSGGTSSLSRERSASWGTAPQGKIRTSPPACETILEEEEPMQEHTKNSVHCDSLEELDLPIDTIAH